MLRGRTPPFATFTDSSIRPGVHLKLCHRAGRRSGPLARLYLFRVSQSSTPASKWSWFHRGGWDHLPNVHGDLPHRPNKFDEVDIEGSEVELFETLPSYILDRIDQVTVAFHDFKPEFELTAKVRAALNRLIGLGWLPIVFSRRDNSDVLLINQKNLELNSLQFAYLKYAARYVDGFLRVVGRKRPGGRRTQPHSKRRAPPVALGRFRGEMDEDNLAPIAETAGSFALGGQEVIDTLRASQVARPHGC